MSEKFIDIVFDGPPSHESGRFVEVEDPDGSSVNAGEWIDRGDGLWALRILTHEADAWDEGHDAGWNARHDDAQAGYMPSGSHESDAVNPYRAQPEEPAEHAVTIDLTPSNHDALLTEVDEVAKAIKMYGSVDEEQGWVAGLEELVMKLATALRTEWSARQFSVAKYNEILEAHQQAWNNAALWKEERDALLGGVDAVLRDYDHVEDCPSRGGRWKCVCWYGALETLTESKEPTSKLDPEPWREDDGTRWPRDGMGGLDHVFDPRPDYSQNPADYGIEAPHE